MTNENSFTPQLTVAFRFECIIFGKIFEDGDAKTDKIKAI